MYILILEKNCGIISLLRDLIRFLTHVLLYSLEEYVLNKLNPNYKEGLIMPDKTLVCKDCNAEFIFSEGEQEFYAEKGFQNEPQRCPACRQARKQQRRNNSYGGGSRGFGKSYSSNW